MNTEQMRNLAAVLTDLADAGIEVRYVSYDGEYVEVWAYSAEELRDRARDVKALVGRLDKEQGSDGIELIGTLHDVTVKVAALGGVCERVQVGTTTVTKPDPNAALVEVEVPVYETRCPESVLANVDTEAVSA